MHRSDRIVLAVALMSTLAAHANAYLDPGSGSALLQILVAGLLGGIFTLKSFWSRLRQRVFEKRSERAD